MEDPIPPNCLHLRGDDCTIIHADGRRWGIRGWYLNMIKDGTRQNWSGRLNRNRGNNQFLDQEWRLVGKDRSERVVAGQIYITQNDGDKFLDFVGRSRLTVHRMWIIGRFFHRRSEDSL